MKTKRFAEAKTIEVGRSCLCLHVQRAARALARHFDEVFRPLDLRHGQFSLLMALNRPEPPAMGVIAQALAMDRTTLTALLKPLERRGLLESGVDPKDRRVRRLRLTDQGHALLHRAHPLWCAAHEALECQMPDASRLRQELLRISTIEPELSKPRKSVNGSLVSARLRPSPPTPAAA